ncbi:nitrophenyl compound nitroreductase subunit ArsF family protein [Ancylomarina sp. 16SWW S1-10-2]|uniref:nitrophenyl compound nitroreductase subunit ArsF family protein n=1 Tax=Ancylomarina sp. 16SWW S1-10-2 TaxID=2499681 RepID=UPI0012AD2D9E|nr:nitrophenyl compound nitroreductase subunit ArsF family protein [Ancylomarina sp. 16SWW S1-10-2]MRT93510.1 thioredoxin [Ancylomarina sp. 16SWW S1-10-2]
MKKLISTLSLFLLVGIVAVSAQCCNESSTCNTASKTTSCCSATPKSNDVTAYYFHATRRCATCQAVEAVSKEAIKEYYGDKVVFKSINRDEAQNKSLVAQYKISGTALLIIKGDKMVNLTNDAFLNARNNPDKLKNKLKSTIDSMM